MNRNLARCIRPTVVGPVTCRCYLFPGWDKSDEPVPVKSESACRWKLSLARRAILSAAIGLFPFDPLARAAESEMAADTLPETAVVFTGVPNRILWGLRLLEEGKIQRLLISGISEEDFVREVRLSRNLAEARAEGRLVLGTRAQSTLENAAETACWLDQEDLAGPILLITSEFHLPRATEALAQAVPGVAITPLGVLDPTDPSHVGKAESEARKLPLTRALRFLPQSLAMREGFADCSGVELR